MAPLRSAVNNKSPVKIRGIEHYDKFKIIVIKHNTTITPSQEALQFGPLDSLESHVTIESLQFTSPQQLVNLKVTVKHVSGSKVVKAQKGTLTKSTATLVDPTGSVTAVFWEEWVDCIQLDKTYIFTNLRVKKDNYSGQIYLNTAKEGFNLDETIAFEEQLAEMEPTVMDMTTKDASTFILE